MSYRDEKPEGTVLLAQAARFLKVDEHDSPHLLIQGDNV